MRKAGILMPISSLASSYGIGSLGEEAYKFVDFLKTAKQEYWQILPIGPTGYGDSPYQSFSAFATNSYFIDLTLLQKQGLLTKAEIDACDFETKDVSIDYFKLYKNRKPLLEKAVERFNKADSAYLEFLAKNNYWLDEYALFMAIKGEHNMGSFLYWPKDILKREKTAMENARTRLHTEIVYWQTVEYLFYVQWSNLKKYANENGVEIIGDIPIYVSPDSSDLWANPELFQVDEKGEVTEVAGCPPDAFSSDGQLWGNPLYDWNYHKKQNYQWWIRRMEYATTIYDVVRIDHFRGFESYYAIPAEDETAINGKWRKGPAMDFINALKTNLPNAKIIAEDLGFLTKDVRDMLKQSGFPGMKVLQFAFDSREESDYLPHNYIHNSVVYTGTHDNTTTQDWQYSAPESDVAFCKKYLNVKSEDEFTRCCIRAALSSVADTCIIPMADWLNLGKEARINTPSTLGKNWLWRAGETELTGNLAAQIAELTLMYGRSTIEKQEKAKAKAKAEIEAETKK